jgi:SAM-dependent methyltransferase
MFTRTLGRFRRKKDHAGLLALSTPRERFTLIYEKNYWKSGESRSGTGSTVDAAQLFSGQLATFIMDAGLTSIFDAPCGDWNWMKKFPLPSTVQYIGGDIVASLIRSLNIQYARPNISFIEFDITKDPFPDTNLWICRDCLFHLSFEDIARAFENFASSACEQALLTSHYEHSNNLDIQTGDYRFLNLSSYPFELPPPSLFLTEQIVNETRYVGLWQKSDLATAAARYRSTRNV